MDTFPVVDHPAAAALRVSTRKIDLYYFFFTSNDRFVETGRQGSDYGNGHGGQTEEKHKIPIRISRLWVWIRTQDPRNTK
jgi:hypothetical protein